MKNKSPAERHIERVKAAKQAAIANQGKPQNGSAYELMKAALVEDRRRLHDIKSIELKIKLKHELLPQYEDYVAGVLEAGNGAEDDVLMTMMIWSLDIGNLSAAIVIAKYALKHNLNTPDQYQRGTASILAEEAAETALRSITQESDIEEAAALFLQLTEINELTESQDMHDQIRAKLMKAIGYAARQAGYLDQSLTALNRALELNEKAGVKKDIEQLLRDIKKLTPTA